MATPEQIDTGPTSAPPLRKGLMVVACAISGAFVLALAYHPTVSVDLGYHLSYGRRFMQSGQIVRDASFIHPAPSQDQTGQGTQLPPGAWFDDDGNYRFLNANWLSQIALAWLFDRGGWTAMNVTLLVLVAAILALQAAVLRRMGASLAYLPAVWMATGIVGYERFMLRPELLSYICLLIQLWLLCGRVNWPGIVAVTAVQLLAVNLHSFWMLGLGVVGAFALEAGVRAGWQKWIVARKVDADLRGRLTRLAVCLPLAAAAAIVHPDGARNATFPIRTLAYIDEHRITGSDRANVKQQDAAGKAVHPWRRIEELRSPFAPETANLRWVRALKVLLAAAALAAALGLLRGRLALTTILAALVAASLSTRRNVGIPAILAAPLVAGAVHDAFAWLRRRLGAAHWTNRTAWGVAITMLAFCAVSSGWWLFGVVTDRFYAEEMRPASFGRGVSELALPVGCAAWLDEHMPVPGPVFADQSYAGALVFLSEKVTAAPASPNTWATPPDRMLETLKVGHGAHPLAKLDQWDLDIAVVRGVGGNLARELANSDDGITAHLDWAVMHLEGSFAVFARRCDANASMIRSHEIAPESFDVEVFIKSCRRMNSHEGIALFRGASLLHSLAWRLPANQKELNDVQRASRTPRWWPHAAGAWEAYLATPSGKDNARAWSRLGECVAMQSPTAFPPTPKAAARAVGAAMANHARARDCVERALRLHERSPMPPEVFAGVQEQLRNIRTQIKKYEAFREHLKNLPVDPIDQLDPPPID